MDELTARPQLLKQVNLSLIRKVIKAKKTATRAEIAAETNISSTTVRSLLVEMIQNEEIESIGYDESSGGRKAERYCLKPERYHGAAFCITENQLHSLITNVCGDILETSVLEVTNENYEEVIISYLDKLTAEKEIKAIGLGVPGIVRGGSFWRQDKLSNKMSKLDIGDVLQKKYGIPVVMENDLNAISIGFGICYKNEFKADSDADTTLAYIYFANDCISAGFIAGDKVLRGYSNYAGELGLVPIHEDKTLDEYLFGPITNLEYTHIVIKVLSWICGILNPQYIALSGPNLRQDCVGPISDGLSSVVPKPMFAEVIYSPDMWHDYHTGMAHLTAGKMFDDVQFVKE